MTHGSTRARVFHWFVQGGTVRLPDGKTVTVDVDPVVVGRDPGARIVLVDPEVSSLHCELRAVSEGILVKDLGSTNGTFVGTLRIQEAAVTTPTEITVGSTKLVLEPTAKKKVDVGFSDAFGPLVGSSPKMRRVFSVLEKVAATPLSVLILGETGTGKELVARALHDASNRRDKPFVVVDCGSIPPTLAESLLFGHEKGSFTGATERRKGALAEADGGTLFLDELGELPIDLQPKLLRALAEKQVKRVGGSAFEPIDVRVLAATRRDLGAEMNAGRFRSDLFFRIAQVRVELPALRERLADLPLLVEDICAKVGKAEHAAAVVSWIEQRMASHDWPGNVRELVNVASVAATLADQPGAIDDVLTLTRDPVDAPRGSGPATAFTEAKRAAVAVFERDYFTSLTKRSQGNVSEMARQSGMERHHVRAYLRKHNIDKGAV
ncbi:MAG: sigma 54-interacting transcriptional regulator [Polyangiaceae bacterium]